jgi:hypothetical protein
MRLKADALRAIIFSQRRNSLKRRSQAQPTLACRVKLSDLREIRLRQQVLARALFCSPAVKRRT